jgi:hypothetical protein
MPGTRVRAHVRPGHKPGHDIEGVDYYGFSASVWSDAPT